MASVRLSAQDLSFSQYFHAPLLVNPANTGFIPDQDYRIGGNYRNQWASVGTPYRTMGAWADTKLFGDRFETGWMGVGGSLLRDEAGSGTLVGNTAMLSLAYHQMVGYKSLVSAGFGAGFTNKRIDISRLNFDNQWNGKFFDVGIPNNEPFSFSNVFYFDLQAGLNYAWFASDRAYFNLGLSVQHLNRPRESFFANDVSDYRVAPRYNFFLNASFKLQDLWIINPNVYISKRGTATETVLGMVGQRDLTGDGSNQLIAGLYLRNGDAVIPVLGYEINTIRFTINYDATISSLRNLNGTRGAYEISVIKQGVFPTASGRSVKCPTVRF
jgi:type IX secretion system PorP/SprF family membrane protein